MEVCARFGVVVLLIAACARPPPTRPMIRGHVHDSVTGEPIMGVTVAVTVAGGGAMQASAFTEDDGSYVLVDLPDGRYDVTFFFADVELVARDQVVRAGRVVVVDRAIDVAAVVPETIVGEPRPRSHGATMP